MWPILIICSFGYAIISGNIENVNNSIFESLEEVISLSMTLVGTMCLWCGLMEIVKNTSIMKKLIKLLRPILNWLFPESKNNKEAMENISINTISNILGLGNAATPAGIKAMESLQKENKNNKRLSNSMMMLIVLNTTSIELNSNNSNSYKVVFKCSESSRHNYTNMVFYNNRNNSWSNIYQNFN